MKHSDVHSRAKQMLHERTYESCYVKKLVGTGYSALVQVKLEQLSQSSMDWVTVTKQV